MNSNDNYLPPDDLDISNAEDEIAEFNELKEKVDKFLLDPSRNYGDPKFLFSREKIGFFSLGDIQAIKAPQKNGKTFLISLLIGALLRGEYNGIKCEIENPKVIFIDTEQHPRNTQLVYRRSCLIGGVNGRIKHDNFKAYHMRGLSPNEIKDYVLFIISSERPTIIFIDGLVDMIENFNDHEESMSTILKLMDYSMKYDCCICNVLHVNPGTDKMRGHAGTILAQKSSDVLCCLKDKKNGQVTFNVEQTDARNRDISSFSFVIEDSKSGDEWIAIPKPAYISVKTRTKADEVMKDVLHDGPLKWQDLIDKVMERENLKRSASAKLIKEAVESNVISHDPVMGKYRYIGLDMDNEEGLPF